MSQVHENHDKSNTPVEESFPLKKSVSNGNPFDSDGNESEEALRQSKLTSRKSTGSKVEAQRFSNRPSNIKRMTTNEQTNKALADGESVHFEKTSVRSSVQENDGEESQNQKSEQQNDSQGEQSEEQNQTEEQEQTEEEEQSEEEGHNF